MSTTAGHRAAPVTAPDPADPPSRFRSRLAFTGVVAASAAVAAAAGAGSPLFVVYQREWGFADWLLTVAFAVYAVSLIATLLVFGSLSDHVGRRTVVIGALVVNIAASVLFVVADGIGWVIAARLVQGVSTGAATSTFTAMIVELAPPSLRRSAPLIASSGPVGGLALGAVAGGAAVQFTDSPGLVVFGGLAVAFVLGIAAVALAAETAPRRPGALRSLVPSLAVPRAAAADFATAVPLVTASWMLSGLFLGLGPSVDHLVLSVDSGLANGLVVGLQPAASAVTAVTLGRMPARRAGLLGAALLGCGAAVAAVGVLSGLFPVFATAAVIGGIGFGLGFPSVLRTLTPLAALHERGGLFAAVFLVSYLAYGIPALVAGVVLDDLGPTTTVVGYASVTVLLAGSTGLAQLLRSRRGRREPLRLGAGS